MDNFLGKWQLFHMICRIWRHSHTTPCLLISVFQCTHFHWSYKTNLMISGKTPVHLLLSAPFICSICHFWMPTLCQALSLRVMSENVNKIPLWVSRGSPSGGEYTCSVNSYTQCNSECAYESLASTHKQNVAIQRFHREEHIQARY